MEKASARGDLGKADLSLPNNHHLQYLCENYGGYPLVGGFSPTHFKNMRSRQIGS